MCQTFATKHQALRAAVRFRRKWDTDRRYRYWPVRALMFTGREGWHCEVLARHGAFLTFV